MSNARGLLVILSFFLAMLLLALIKIIIPQTGISLYLELFGLIFLMFLAALAYLGFPEKWSRLLFATVFILYAVNLLVMWIFKDTLYVVLLVTSLIGVLLSLMPAHHPQKSHHSAQPDHSIMYSATGESAAQKVAQLSQDDNSSPSTLNTTHSPGKYVASVKGKFFHEPKSEWAQKISRKNRVWFHSKSQAQAAGYKPHKSVS